MGWLGTQRELFNTLRAMHADRGPQGQFVVRGSFAPFLGVESPSNEILVGEDAEAMVAGKWRPIRPAGGMYLTVIGTAEGKKGGRSDGHE